MTTNADICHTVTTMCVQPGRRQKNESSFCHLRGLRAPCSSRALEVMIRRTHNVLSQATYIPTFRAVARSYTASLSRHYSDQWGRAFKRRPGQHSEPALHLMLLFPFSFPSCATRRAQPSHACFSAWAEAIPVRPGRRSATPLLH